MIDLHRDFLRVPLSHRGYHDAALGLAENSAAAIQAAVDVGYGIELDLQPSADGQAMVFHDATLDRVTGQSGFVRDLTAQELAEIPLLGSTDTIPTLPDILKIVDGTTPLLIELKSQGQKDDGVLETATARALQTYPGPVAVMSFDPRMVARLAQLLPSVARGLTTGSYGPNWSEPPQVRERLRDIPDYDAVQASFISHEAADLTCARVAGLKDQGAAILTWTIRSQADETKARKIADKITFEGYAAVLP